MDTRTDTTGTTGTTDIEGLLPLLWLASPALPVGAFSYSEALEPAAEAGLVSNEAQARDWLVQQLHLVLARADLPVVGRAMAAWRDDDLERVRVLDDWVLQTRETAEFRQQTLQMGRSMMEWLKAVHPDAARRCAFPVSYPIAGSLAASSSGAGMREALGAFAFGWSENMVQAAVRIVPLGQTAGQRILARLAGEIPRAVDDASRCEEPLAFSPMLAILSSRHEHQYSRLFRS